ncbi:zinc finger, CCHC-type containing protein [Tanacetum coccineum]
MEDSTIHDVVLVGNISVIDGYLGVKEDAPPCGVKGQRPLRGQGAEPLVARRWQKKMYFLLTTLKVVYVLTTPMSELLEDATVEAIRIRAKWENDDYICRGHILNGMSGSLFDVYTNVEWAKELWDSLESQELAEDSSSKKFLVSNFNNYKMVDSRPVMEQYNELLRILGQYTQHGLKMDESISVSSIIDKLPSFLERILKHTFETWKRLFCLWSNFVSLAYRGISNGGKTVQGQGGIAVVVNKKTQCWLFRKRGLRTIPKTKVDAIAWWIDSGATTHVCKDRCWFKTYEPVEDGSVLYMGDDHFAPVHGKGSVVLEFSSGKSITLFNVLYVPKLRKNLISGPVLNKCGYKQVYESDKYILSKCGVFVGFGYYNNGMFMLNLNKVSDDSDSVYMSSSSTVVNSSLWHARLGHVHYKRMLEMSKDELIPAIDENPDKCTTCMLTKITRQPFKSITRKSVILELIHSDLCDFHATPSLGNKKYVITFIDDASRFCYVYLLHAKDEALDKFRIYKTEVELQQNDLIKTLRTDRGGEYYDPVFFQSVGIIHETTAPYTPQQNGVAERKNRALKEMVNSMLSYSGLSEGFWGESIAVVRLPDPKRKTLGEKGIDCIFVGYAKHSKVYRNDHSDDVPSEIPKPRKGKRVRKAKPYGFDFQLYLVEGSRDQIGSQYSYCYSIEEDLRTYNEAMQSRDYVFWKEAIDDEIGSIMENNTWVLSDLPPGFKPLGCK